MLYTQESQDNIAVQRIRLLSAFVIYLSQSIFSHFDIRNAIRI